MRREPIAAAVMLLALAGCGGAGDEVASSPDADADVASPAAGPADQQASAPQLRPPPCPAAAANCERASGQIIYVERIDPDGDGDAHFVLISDESITAPGISVIDVRADLRPRPLPGPGDMLAASGPVYEGHLGQLQIQADAVRVADSG
jgi:hypothetical protein